MPGITFDLTELEKLGDEFGKLPDQILDELDGDTGSLIREVMSNTAKNMAPSNKYKAGGTLRQLIDSSEQGFSKREGDGISIGITSHADYSIYVEYGTGYKGDPRYPHTPKKSWMYFDKSDQVLRFGKPQPARHFMEPALEDNVDNICEIIAGNIEEVFEND